MSQSFISSNHKQQIMNKQIIPSRPPLPPNKKQFINQTYRHKSLSQISPPKHILRFINSDPMLQSSFSTNNMLERFSPNKSKQQKQIRQDFGNQYFEVMGQNIKDSGHSLEDFVKKNHVIFRSRHLQHYKELQCIKDFEQKCQLTQEKQKKSQIYFNTPPTKFNSAQRPQTNFESAKVSPIVAKKKYVKPQPLNTTLVPQLQFSDNFESSNLAIAVRSREDLYQLILRNDYNTLSYTKWFYFKVKNVTQFDQNFNLNIINLQKSQSFFGNKMKISVNRCGIWNKQGKNIMYFRNQFQRYSQDCSQNKKNYYTLSFQILIHAHEQIYIASNLPYTYSQLNSTLAKISPSLNSIMKRQILCRTTLGNRVQILTFHKEKQKKNNQQLKQQKKQENQKNRYASSSKNIRSHILLRRSQAKSSKATLDPYHEKKMQRKNTIVILARSISSQTSGSYIVEGMLEQFASPLNQNTHNLLQQYTIKIIPMINPDGVIIGNTQCNLKGYNLYNNWNGTGQSFEEHIPQLHKIRQNIMTQNQKICMLIDLHQHDEKYGVNVYGCKGIKPNKNKIQKEFLKGQFLHIFGQIIGQKTIIKKTHLANMQQDQGLKEGTAKVLFWRSLHTPNIYQLKICNCCSSQSQYHYDQSAFKILGKQLLQAISIFLVSQRKVEKLNMLKEKQKQMSFCSKQSQLQQFNEERRIFNDALIKNDVKIDSQRSNTDKEKKQCYHRPIIPHRRSASKSKSPTKNKTHNNINNEKTISDNNQLSMKTESDNTIDNLIPTRVNLKSSRSIKSIPSKIQKATATIEKGITFKTSHNRQKSKSNGGELPLLSEKKQLVSICEVSGELKDSNIKQSYQLKNLNHISEDCKKTKTNQLLKDFQIIQNCTSQKKQQKIPSSRQSVPINNGRQKPEKMQLTFLQRIGLQNSRLPNPYQLTKLQANKVIKKKDAESQIKNQDKSQ